MSDLKAAGEETKVHVEGDVAVKPASASASLPTPQPVQDAPETTAQNRQTAENAAKTLGDNTRSGAVIQTEGTEQLGADERGTQNGEVQQPQTSAAELAAADKKLSEPKELGDAGNPALRPGETEEQRDARVRNFHGQAEEAAVIDPLSPEGLRLADEDNKRRQAEIEARQAGPATTSFAPVAAAAPAVADLPPTMESDATYRSRLNRVARRRLIEDLATTTGDKLDEIGRHFDVARQKAGDEPEPMEREDEVLTSLDGLHARLDKLELRLRHFA